MRPESAMLVAVVIAICAVISALGAVLMVRAMSRSRSGLVERRAAIARAAGRTSRDAADMRARMEHTVTTVERIRADGASWDADIGRLTDSLHAQREGIEWVTRGRLATVIRMATMVSKAARFAFLWR